MAIQVTRTYIGSIQNQRQVQRVWIRSVIPPRKIWNVARWTADRIWDKTGVIRCERSESVHEEPSVLEDLNAQSSQKSH